MNITDKMIDILLNDIDEIPDEEFIRDMRSVGFKMLPEKHDNADITYTKNTFNEGLSMSVSDNSGLEYCA